MLKIIWPLFILEGPKELIAEQPRQCVAGLVLAFLGKEISISSLGGHSVGRAGLTGESFARWCWGTGTQFCTVQGRNVTGARSGH